MAVRIRLARLGCRNRPFYRIVVADSHSRRDGDHIEIVGFVDPLSGKDGQQKQMALKLERVQYWLSVGAQPTEPVERILLRAGILSPPPNVVMGGKGGKPLTGGGSDPEKQNQPKEGADTDSWSSLSLPVEGAPA